LSKEHLAGEAALSASPFFCAGVLANRVWLPGQASAAPTDYSGGRARTREGLRRGLFDRSRRRSGHGHRQLHLDDVVLDRVDDQIADRVKVEFAHDVAAMRLRGLGAQ